MLKTILGQAIPSITQEQLQAFEHYYNKLTDWNENRCNLTAITDLQGVAQKHFCDSILPMALIPSGARCIDIGTGAGFPGIPLKIMRPDIELVMIDSLQKRIDFLNELTSELSISASAIHARAEDAAYDPSLRAQFDIALTRAVSQTNILLEWTTPFLKIGGKSLMYKGASAASELSVCNNALKTLNLSARIETFDVSWGERVIICATKLAHTPPSFPRKPGIAKKRPL